MSTCFNNSRFIICLFMLLIGSLPIVCSATDLLDHRLDGDGVMLYQHPYADAGSDDRPIANCPVGDGQLVISRSGERVVAVRRLRFDGSEELATEWGYADSVTFTSDSTREDVALCRQDGSVLLAMSGISGTSMDTKLYLMALDTQGNTIAGTFEETYTILFTLDSDDFSSIQNWAKIPRSFNRTPDGGALLVGSLDTPDGFRPFVVRFEGTQARFAGLTTFVPTGLSGNVHATAAGVGPSGGIWVVGYGQRDGLPDAAFRAYLQPDTLALAHTEVFSMDGEHVRTAGGGMVRNGVLAVGATHGVGSLPAHPMMLVFRSGGSINSINLPNPSPLVVGGNTGVSHESVGSVLPLSGNRVLYAATATAFDGTQFRGQHGWYFARAIVGATSTDDHVDHAFADAGQTVLTLASGDPSCSGFLNRQSHARLGFWFGLPSVLGSLSHHCNPNTNDDVVLMRLAADPLVFSDSFE